MKPAKFFLALVILAILSICTILMPMKGLQADRRKFTRKGPLEKDSGKELSFYKAKRGTFRPQDTAFATVNPVSKELIRAPFHLRIEKLFKCQGSIVKAGDVLAVFRSPELSEMIRRWILAERQVKLAQKSLKFTLIKKNAQLATSSDTIKAQLKLNREKEEFGSIQKGLKEAMMALGFPMKLENVKKKNTRSLFRVYSPINGIVKKRFISEGVSVPENAPLFSIEDASEVILKAYVSCRKVRQWTEGKVFLENNQKNPLALLSDRPVFDYSTGLCELSFRAKNQDGRLLPDQITRVMALGPSVPCVYVPIQAVVSRSGENFCIVKRPTGLETVMVKVGKRSGRLVAVLTGLLPGDLVVTTGAYEMLYRDINQLMKFEEQ